MTRLPAKPPLKGEVPALGRRRGSFPNATKVTAALSAAVTTTKQQEPAPTLRRNQLRRSHHPKRQPLFGREGSGGRGASLREAASPPSTSPTLVFRGGSAREGTFLPEKSPPSQSLITTYEFFRCLPWGARSGRGRCPARQRPDRRSGDGGDCRGKRRRRPECAHGSPSRGDGQSWRADPP